MKNRISKKTINILSLLFILCSNFISGQNFNNNNYWGELLLNNREKSLTDFYNGQKKLNELESLFTEQILRVENGYQIPPENFINNLLEQKNIEPYLYAFWKDEFLFDNYLTTGFHKRNINAIDKIAKLNTTNTTIKEALLYLKAISHRHRGNWNGYSKNISEMGTIRNWQFCGVFENLNNSGLDISYQPESNAISEIKFNANSNGFVNWYTPDGFKKEAYQFFTNHSEFGYGVHYAQTFMDVPEEKLAVLRIGNSSKFKVWLNDVLVFENTKDVDTELDSYTIQLRIPKGKNRLLIKNVEGNGVSYFIARLTDNAGLELKDITFSDIYSPYNNSTLEDINPTLFNNKFEEYFIRKIKEDPTNFFHQYALIKTYLRNGKFSKAKQVVLPIYQKYPKSSLLRKLLILCYDLEADYTSIKEIKKNLELDDENYYLTLLYKFTNRSEISRMDINQLEEFLKKFSTSTNHPILKLTGNFILNVRKSDKNLLKKDLDQIIEQCQKDEWIYILKTYAPLYSTLFNDDARSIKILEEINKNYYNYSIANRLATYYEKQGGKEKALKLFLSFLKPLENENFLIENIIKKLHKQEKFAESLEFIELGLKNFPYSFKILKLKGNALRQLNKKEEAVAAYKKSLLFNSGDSHLRKQIQDLTNQKDPLEEYRTKDISKYINDHRNIIDVNNYGYNILLDEEITILYPEGGGKSSYCFIYEITSESGVESFKEHNLNLTGSYNIIKSQIIKPNGSVIPADRKNSSFVFKGLEVGDVINITYEMKYNGTGRFFKDFTDYYQFDSFHPCVRSIYKILIPKEQKLNHHIANGKINLQKKELKDFILYEWELGINKVLPTVENYMPVDADIARYLHISTISSWNDIAFWYSDLVRSQIEINSEVEIAFNSIFPNGIDTLTEEEKSKKIYYYLMNNLNYSYVSFRQGGFIPQKPSKTLKTKLGDCKDFSTLFVTLAEKAELQSNLVLISTSDYGEKSMILPSQDFNHCIVKVLINEQPQFLELTDKYLPYKSLPNSLIGATALEIPYKNNKDKSFELFKLDNVEKTSSTIKCDVSMHIKDKSQKLNIVTHLTGSNNSYYASVFEEPNYDVIKKSLSEDLKGRTTINLVIDSISRISYNRNNPEIEFVTDVSFKEKINKIGTTSIYQLPNILNAYNSDIISLEERNYPIDYLQYENTEQYITNFDIYIGNDQKFIEIPKSNSFSFKNHSYSIQYELVKKNHLKVRINAITNFDKIEPEDYAKFKEYVKLILEAKDTYIGYQ